MDDKAEASREDQSLVDQSSGYYESDRVVIDDWSQTGRGSHVDFGDDETVPLQTGKQTWISNRQKLTLVRVGRFLGRGAVGDVHETTLRGWKLAHKKIMFRRKIGEKEKKEIEILKRLSHTHVVQLVGTYTQQRLLGIILYPVAVCDLHTFFDDVESWTATQDDNVSRVERELTLEPAQRDRLRMLNYDFPVSTKSKYAQQVYYKIGCLISAIAYLHEQKIRHKDLKPSNILLSRDRIWLTDFGSATDFTLLSQSATDNERGTPRYFAPEMAAWQPSGRAADIFALGCILLEIMVLSRDGTLNRIRQNRSSDPSFHANLDKVDTWLDTSRTDIYGRSIMLRTEIRNMLAEDPEKRPTASELSARVIACDLMRTPGRRSIFHDCCRVSLVPNQQIEDQKVESKKQIANLQAELKRVNEKVTRQEAQLKAAEEKFDMYEVNLSSDN